MGAHRHMMMTLAVTMSLASFSENVLNGFLQSTLLPGIPSSSIAPRTANKAQNGEARRSNSLQHQGQRSVRETVENASSEEMPARVAIDTDRLILAASMPTNSMGMPRMMAPWKRGKGGRYVTPENQADIGNQMSTPVSMNPANSARNGRRFRSS